MHVLVVGAGSIGRRHIRNLVAAGVDVSAVRQRVTLSHELASEFGIRTSASLEDALHTKPDAVVVCNRTDQHLDTALAAARRGCHLYIEKPVSHSISSSGVRDRTIVSRTARAGSTPAVVSSRESIEVMRVVVSARESAKERRVVGIFATVTEPGTGAEMLQ